MTFNQFFESLRLDHFDPEELLIGLNSGNSMPPENLWGNIALTMTVLDELREYIGLPITVTSAYRSPSYNSKVGGAALSQHMAFSAIDFKVGGSRDAKTEAEIILKHWRGRHFLVCTERRRAPVGNIPIYSLETWDQGDGLAFVQFHGGIGSYENFTHLDTRGLDVNWFG